MRLLLAGLFACTPAFAFTVGGNISGLTSTLVLRLNSSTFHIYPAGVTSYKFDTQLSTGDPYSIAVGIQPLGQNCTVANSLGIIGAANITNVNVTCLGTTSVVLTWSKPTQNTDGSALNDLAGYRIYYGTSQTAMNTVRLIANPNTTSTTITGLSMGKAWYFAIASANTAGEVGPKSNAASKGL